MKSENSKLKKYKEFVVNDHSLSMKILLNYSRSTLKIDYFNQVVNVIALLRNMKNPLTGNYESMSLLIANNKCISFNILFGTMSYLFVLSSTLSHISIM